MANNLLYFLAKYGPDFVKKLPMYSTAKWQGQPVKMLMVDAKKMRCEIKALAGERQWVSVYELDDFVL